MRRTPLLWIVLPIVAITLAVLAIVFIKSRSTVTSEALKAIPIDAAIVVKASSLGQLSDALLQSNEFWEGVESFNVVADANSFFELAQNLADKSPVFGSLLYGNPLFFSAHPVGKGSAELFFTANLPEKVRESELRSFIDKEFAQKYTLTSKDYNNAVIFTYTHNDEENGTSYSFAIHQGVIMCSQSQLLIESALGQLANHISLLNNPQFIEVYHTAGTKVVANVFLNYTRLPNIFLQHIHSRQRESALNLSKVGRWSELDLTIKNDEFYLNGFAQTPDSINTFLKVFSKQKPVEMRVQEVLPTQTAALVFLGISNFKAYLNQYRQFLSFNGRARAHEDELKKLSTALGCNVEEFYTNIFSEEISLAFIPFEGEDYDNSWFVVSRVKSQGQAKQEFQNLLSDYASKQGVPASRYEKTFAIDREKSVSIFKLPQSGMHQALFGSVFEPVNDLYFTFIDSYVVFGSSFNSLSLLVLAKVHNKQLALEQSYKEFSKGLTAESNFVAYINPGKAEMLYGQLLEPASASRLLSRAEALKRIQGIAVQLTGNKGMVYQNLYAKYSPYTYDSPQTVWETRLDTTISIKPQLVINHNTQAREIFVQDNSNNIYLINEVGRVLWKRPLPEEIMGEVHQIDVYRNGKLQLLFNTRSSLYLVDRNGNNVEGYPVTLRSPATNPVAVFDYDNNRNYRYFIAGEDRKVYVYNKNGNIVTGWDFDRSEREVHQQIQHFRAGTRDYIVFADNNRLYILDRRGDTRVKVSDFFSKAENATIVLDGASSSAPRFVTTDTLGVVRLVYTDGRVESKAIQRVSSNHVFDCQDVNGDGSNDYIFLDNNKLSVYSQSGKELFSQKFKEELLPSVIYFHFGVRDRKLGVVSAESAQIFLVNGDGSLYKGFPLKGITPFSIGRFAGSKSTFNLIAGSSSGYVLNYAVQ